MHCNQFTILFKIFLLMILSNTYCNCASFGIKNTTACFTMIPLHGNSVTQTSIPPVLILPHSITIARGQQLKITIQNVASNYTFKGFLIQARADSKSNEILGHFLSPADSSVKIMACGNSYSTVSQADPSQKSNILLYWRAPTHFRGSIKFL